MAESLFEAIFGNADVSGSRRAEATKPEDAELRKFALQQSAMIAMQVSSLNTDAAIVKRAEAFYGFLRGEQIAVGSADAGVKVSVPNRP